MRQFTAMLGFIWLAATVAGAEEPKGAPLEASKQELKRLQTDQAGKGNGTATGKMTDGLPQFETPVPGPLQQELSRPDKSRTEKDPKRKEAQKNWLLDGVDKLGKDKKARGRETETAKDASNDDDPEKADSSDPDYLLKVYAERKKSDEAKAERSKPATVRTDPFAPFLQGWLENTPARGKFFDEFMRRPDAGGGGPVAGPGSPTSGGPIQGSGGGDVAGPTRAIPTVTQPNPYLQGLDMPSLQEAGGSHNQPAATVNPFNSPVPAQPPGGLVEPVPADRPVEKKSPFLAPPDDKIYFPQLKRF